MGTMGDGGHVVPLSTPVPSPATVLAEPHALRWARFTLLRAIRTVRHMNDNDRANLVSSAGHRPTGSGSTKVLGTVAIAGLATFVAIFAAMHLIQTDLNPVASFGSDYALGRAGWLMQLGFMSAGIGVLSLALGLRGSLALGARRRLAVGLVAAAGVGFVGSGLFSTDPPLDDGTTGYTTEGTLHDLAGMVLFLSLIIGTFVLARVFRRDPRWARMAPVAKGFAWASLAGLIVTLIAGEAGTPPDEGVVGLVQRVFIVIIVAWLLLVSSRVRELGAAQAPTIGTTGASP